MLLAWRSSAVSVLMTNDLGFAFDDGAFGAMT